MPTGEKGLAGRDHVCRVSLAGPTAPAQQREVALAGEVEAVAPAAAHGSPLAGKDLAACGAAKVRQDEVDALGLHVGRQPMAPDRSPFSHVAGPKRAGGCGWGGRISADSAGLLSSLQTGGTTDGVAAQGRVVGMQVEKNAGDLIGWGIATLALGGVISVLSVLGVWEDGNGPLVLGAMISLVGLGLLITGISKVVRNVEVATEAQLAAVEQQAKAEEHLRHIRWVTATQYNEERGLSRELAQ